MANHTDEWDEHTIPDMSMFMYPEDANEDSQTEVE